MPRRPCGPMRPTSRTTRPGATGTVSSPMPATPEVVGAYLAAAGEGYALPTLRRRVAAIARACGVAGHPLDTKHPAIRETLRGIGRKHGSTAAPSSSHHHGGGQQAVPGMRAGSRWRTRPRAVSPRLCRRVAAFRTGRARCGTRDLDGRRLEAAHRALEDRRRRRRRRDRHPPRAGRRHLPGDRPAEPGWRCPKSPPARCSARSTVVAWSNAPG